MLELEQALEKILAAMPAPVPERIPLDQANGRFLTGDVISPIDLPAFDNSAMDGYAVRSADIANAALGSPVTLTLMGKVAAGQVFRGEVTAGHCIRVFTGSPLPAGSDAVVMQEDTSQGSSGDTIQVLSRATAGENVRFHGEDVRAGVTLLKKGEVLSAGSLGLLAACGLPDAAVGRRPRVAILATGSELREAGQDLKPGQIYESNRAALAELVRSAGAVPVTLPIVPDTFEGTTAASEQAFATADAVITCGGVSVGEMDFVKTAFESIGGKLEFWRVAIKPGRPFVFGQLGHKLLLGLPGNPVSAFVTFLLLVRPAVLKWQGASLLSLPIQAGVTREGLLNAGARRHFVRVRVDERGGVFLAGAQASHIVAGLARANGLVDLAPGQEVPEGTAVQVLRF